MATGPGGEVELVMQDDQIVIRSLHKARWDWDEAFRVMTEHGDDALLDDDVATATTWDAESWEW